MQVRIDYELTFINFGYVFVNIFLKSFKISFNQILLSGKRAAVERICDNTVIKTSFTIYAATKRYGRTLFALRFVSK